MRGGVAFQQGDKLSDHQYGGLAVPSGLRVNTSYALNQIQYDKNTVLKGGSVDHEVDVIPDGLFQSLINPLIKTQRGGTDKTQRSDKDDKVDTAKTKRNK